MTKIEKLCIKWLNDNYNHMEPFIMKEYPDYIFHMKNGKCILQHNKKNGYVYVSYSEIWKFFENMFGMSNQQIKDITKIWVEEHYKVGITTESKKWKEILMERVEEHYKVGVATTGSISVNWTSMVEEHYKVGVKSTQEFGWRLQKQVDEQYKEGITTTKRHVYEHINMAEERYKEITTTNNQLQFYLEKDVEELYLTNKQEIQ
jgi:hypothetical protein